MQHIVRKLVISIAACLYLASLLLFIDIDIYNAPDEHATHLFIEQVRNGSLPRMKELENQELYNVIHPRSTTVVGNYIVPIGFIGIPIWYGSILDFLPGRIPPEALTVFIIVAAGFAWYQIMYVYLGGKQEAKVATVLLLTLPPFWFYATRGLMPNVPFISLAIIAFYLFDIASRRYKNRSWILAGIAGLAASAAISIRPLELPWVIVMGVVYAIWGLNWKQEWKKVICAGTGFVLGIAPILILQNQIYGSALTTGYTVQNEIIYEGSGMEEAASAFQVPGPIVERGGSWLGAIFERIFPFGFHERLIIEHAFENIVILLPLVALFSALGLIALIVEKKKEWIPYMAGIAIGGGWLIAMYGSWVINDNPDPLAITLGNSYSRYWLPLYVGLIPVMVIGIKRLAKRLRAKQAIGILAMIWVLFGAITLLKGEDSLFKTRERLLQFKEDQRILLQEIPPEATVITFFADKYIHPHREVVINLTSPATIHALPKLLDRSEVYYFGLTLPEEDVAFYTEQVLDHLPEPHRLEEVRTIREQTLYRIRPL